MSGAILTLNAGSSSLKFALFDASLTRFLQGKVENIGVEPHLRAFASDGRKLVDQRVPGTDHEHVLDTLLDWVEGQLGSRRVLAAGHRIVHGGAEFTESVWLTPMARQALARLCPLAPLHQSHNLAAVTALAKLRPGLLQVGCFDTAFHVTMDATRRRFGLPRALEKRGIRRYGFHGLSYEHIAIRLWAMEPARAQGRIVVAHLGSGSSLCALHGGRSIDTAMGFTTLDGLLMGTRCGALDPGVVLHLLREGMSPSELEDLLYHRSGLLGVSGLSEDMRDLLASGAPEAQEAIDLFVFRAIREIAAMTASLGGMDGLVFTGGIGENAPLIRDRTAAGLAWLGLRLDGEANQAGKGLISVMDSPVPAWVIPADEEEVIARHTRALLNCAGSIPVVSRSGILCK